jgi:SAM-dependent methyltransferase
MDFAREQWRFSESNRLITEKIGPVRTLLEIGCGEGHQTEHLKNLAQEVYGVDISHRAISRARIRNPDPRMHYSIGDLKLLSMPSDLPRRFDLVTAFEVLYYVPNRKRPDAIRYISSLADFCMVSCYEPHKEALEDLVAAIPTVSTEFRAFDEQYAWWFAWWKNEAPVA